ncbi:hypothetical protein ASE12_07825 [Aeromicrobium sp. Root236]|uniref:hypothetical protein n=1 Tax=Aeromicrobium sp. Root236 TaxID=1736498 RepID=UPI0007008A47|nr:hypothetical protein [Aeromicrobium sp. Root236]KRC64682.1 hypothetical protein ASE12_07825 [Aeromicrobium sp. Root236]
MFLSDVLRRPVVGPDGPLGFVVDCRLAVDGSPGQLLADAQLVGLIVAPKQRQGFLGYERTSVSSPAPLAQWYERRQRGSFLVLWKDIASIDDVVRVRPGYTRWSSAL